MLILGSHQLYDDSYLLQNALVRWICYGLCHLLEASDHI